LEALLIDVFRVGVHLGMTSNGPQVIGLLIRELGLLHGSVDSLATKWTNMKPLIGGAVAAFAGIKALEGMWKIVEASKELNKQLEKTRQLGGEFADTLAATRATAFRTSLSVPTTTPADNVKVQRELGAQMQNPDAAASVLPLAQKTAYVISNFTGEKTEDIVKNLAKVAELRAQIFSVDASGKETVDPAKVMAEFNSAMKALLLTGGFLKSNDLVQIAKQAGVPAKTMTAEAFYADAAEMAVSQGASRTGTALTSMYQQLIGGTMQRKTAEEMQKFGMLNQGEWQAKRGGAIVVQEEARNRLQNQIGPDPIAYITGPLNDLMTKQGLDQQGKLQAVFALFGRQTTQRLVAEALSSGPLFERARKMFGTIPGVDEQYKELQSKDLDTNIKSFTAAWQGLMQALGEQGIPLAITIMHKLTDALHAMTAWAVENPGAIHNIEMIAVALASLAAVGGSLVVASFGIQLVGGALGFLSTITGLTALGGGLATLGSGIGKLMLAGEGIAVLASRLSLLGGAIAGIYGILKLGSDNETPENRKRLEDLNKERRRPTPLDRMEPQDGFDVEGHPVARPQSFRARDGAPTARGISFQPNAGVDSGGKVELHGDINMDGKKVGELVAYHLGRDMNAAPRSGSTGSDMRVSPWGGALAI